MVNNIEKTCPNCKNCIPDEHLPRCKLAKYAVSGNYASASLMRVSTSDDSIVYDDRVTGPCGSKSLYWEDGRDPVVELGWHNKASHIHAEVMAFDSPLKAGEIRAVFDKKRRHEVAYQVGVITPEEAIRLLRKQTAVERLTKFPELEDLDLYSASANKLENPASEGESLIDKALKQHENKDVWGKPFKMAE